ncbi:MAG: 3-deoxy-7-phosphoheptulonate synthase, partial [Glycomyces artemisiae]|nr:3-deoxy-7-phosphoheptulonate synthase [Glycomyces artemisiae]
MSTPSDRAAVDTAGDAPQTSDLRIRGFQPLVAPAVLRGELPLGPDRAALVAD